MKASQRLFGTEEALGIASIIETAACGGYNLDQDLKGRWHIWVSNPSDLIQSDSISRQLEPDLYG
jgi:hypothetical protein